MTKRTLAALCALLVAASTLAVVAQPAAAHSQTTTKQRCSYDPFAGQQCWTETVTVSHTHTCGAGMTGTFPNCYPIPPANQNCGAGTTGTFPNCYPIPSDNSNHDKDKGGTDKTEPDSTEPDKTEPDKTEPDKTEPDKTEPDKTEPDKTEPDKTEPDKTEPDKTEPDKTEPDKTEPGTGTTTTTTPPPTTTTADPCGDYADGLIDALNKVNDGTNSSFDPPAQPAGCAGPSGRELAGYVRVMGNNWLREIGEIFEDWKEATAGVAELEAEERDKAIEEYRKAWNELPRPVQVATTYAGCAVLSTAALGAIVKGKPSVAARISQRAGDLGCTIGVDWIDLSIDDGGTGDGGTDDSDTDDDAADDGGTDDSDSNDDNDPPDSDAVTEAEGAAAKARADYQANRSWQNRKALIDAINRLRCLQPKLYICSTSP